MALSPIAAKALAKVEASCYILYGSGYFSGEEWTRLDLLLHKGKHVFEDGPSQPASNHVYVPTNEETRADTRKQTVSSNYTEELLLVFDDMVEEVPEAHAPVKGVGSSSQNFDHNDKIMSELEIASPMSAKSVEPANTFSPVESSDSSVSSVTYEVPKGNDFVSSASVDAAHTTESERMSRPKTGLATAPVSQPDKASQHGPKPGLPPGVTLEQLELAKSFMGGVAKKYVASPSPQHQSAKKTTSAKQEPERIDWATEVNEAAARDELPSRPRSVLSSAPSARAFDPLLAGLSAAENLRRIELFTKTLGRPPRTVSDYYQPNNPDFRPWWLKPSIDATSPRNGAPGAPTSLAAFHARSASSLGQNKSPNSGGPQHHVPSFHINPGSVYVATESQSNGKTATNLAFDAGDKIRIFKYVSGNTWLGENLRTKMTGQVLKTALKKNSASASRNVPQVKPASIQNLVDDIEETNAAQWEVDADIGVSTDRAQLKVGEKSSHEEPSVFTGIKEETRVEVEKIWDEKFTRIITRNQAINSSDNSVASFETAEMARRRRNQVKYTSPHRLVVPKTEVCWFWASNNSCRFQEHECRDLHEHRDNTAGTNFRDGRVTTWGSIRDYVDPVPEPPAGEEHTPPKDPSTTVGKQFTCHFWASGFCHHSEDRCKFLHTYVGSQGVLKKPVALAAVERYKDEEKRAKKTLEQQVEEPKAELNEPKAELNEPKAELNESLRAQPATDGGVADATNTDWGQAVASDWGQAVNNSSRDSTANNGWGQPTGDDWGQPTQNGWFLMEGEQREELLGEDENAKEVDEQKDETYTSPAQAIFSASQEW